MHCDRVISNVFSLFCLCVDKKSWSYLFYHNIGEFLNRLEKAFGDPDCARTACTRLHDLKMTLSMSADDYTAQFEILSGQTGFNDEALEDAYA